MLPSRDTICALASGPPPSAIAIIRVSGPDLQALAPRFLRRPLSVPSAARLNSVLAEDGSVIDTGLCLFMAGPRSYTGEDTLEMYIHGGAFIIDRTLERLHALGIRLAEPGEFTRRAFEAGKMDLTQAEAIADLIDAETAAQHKLAQAQLGGALSVLYGAWRESLTEILALIEASIDFPDEEDAPTGQAEYAQDRLLRLINDLEDGLAAGGLTERIRDGFQLVILGAPNAGKSTLLNRLAKRDAAIVTPVAGTTRDVIEVRLKMGGYLVWLADTAGLRDSDDEIEQMGVTRAKQMGENADLRLWLYDARSEFTFSADVQPNDLVVANKSDLLAGQSVSRETLYISAETGDGIESLLSAITERLVDRAANLSAPTLTRARHRQGLERALANLRQAAFGLENNLGAELVAEDVRSAARALSALTGHIETEAILGTVFATFCIGK